MAPAPNGGVRLSFSTDDDFNSLVHLRDPKTLLASLSKTTLGDVPLSPLPVAKDGSIFVSTAGTHHLDPSHPATLDPAVPYA